MTEAEAEAEAEIETDAQKGQGRGQGRGQGQGQQIFHPEQLYSRSYGGSGGSGDSRLVRVAFSQRRVRLQDAAQFVARSGGGGGGGGASDTEFFRLEPFGVSLLEVLPCRIRCRDLYRLVARRFSPYLKVQHAAQRRQRSNGNLTQYGSVTGLSGLTGLNDAEEGGEGVA
ncbi:hypothetical protein B484DRAFT_471628, partial [Ochromonadaceae sp. CCMP2298]